MEPEAEIDWSDAATTKAHVEAPGAGTLKNPRRKAPLLCTVHRWTNSGPDGRRTNCSEVAEGSEPNRHCLSSG